MNLKEYEAMAKIELDDTERKWITERIDILEAGFRELDIIDTSDTEALISVLNVKNVFREDNMEKIISRNELLANAPEQYNGYFQVPKTLD